MEFSSEGIIKKVKDNKIPIAITISSMIINLYFTQYVKAVWSDSAIYLDSARNLLTHNVNNNWMLLRHTVYILFAALFGANAEVVRWATAIFSSFAVAALYYYIKKKTNDTFQAAIGSILFLTNWIFIFFSSRVLTDSFGLVFLTLSMLFTLDKSKKGYILLAITTMLAIFTRRTYIFFYIPLYAYLLIFEFKKTTKNIPYLALGAAIVSIPLLLYYPLVLDKPITSWFQSAVGSAAGSYSIKDTSPTIIAHILGGWVMLAFVIVGAILAMLSNKRKDYYFEIFLIIGIILIFGIRSIPRYSMPLLMPMFVLASFMFRFIKSKVKDKMASSIIILALLLIGIITNLQYGVPIILAKGPTYVEVKEAGIFLRGTHDLIVTQSGRQIVYYSGNMNVTSFPKTEQEFENMHWKYAFLSPYEVTPKWVYTYDWNKYKIIKEEPCFFNPTKICGIVVENTISQTSAS